MNSPQLILKRMGVLNCTPNSFSDGGDIHSTESFEKKMASFGHLESLDIGAESSAPMNESISWKTEWERLIPFLPLLKSFSGVLSFDTYHPETMEEILKYYLNNGFDHELIWNDISGKFDGFAKEFLSMSPRFSYVFCHNLAPKRELSGRHMDYVDPDLCLESLRDYFTPHKLPQVIFDPCLGFSKTYEQNWSILEEFGALQKMVGHSRWLLGFSRKSFLRKKFNLTLTDRDELDRIHGEVLKKISLKGEVWIRTHRPELLEI